MKKILILLLLSLTLFSCNKTICPDNNQGKIVYDTIYVPKEYSNVENELYENRVEELYKQVDSLTTLNNYLAQELLHKSLIIENAKYYLDITNRNPSQDKFLKGWMNRALNQ